MTSLKHLQLRMRWREVLQKYRWTVDYNDQHEIKKRCEYFDEMNELFGMYTSCVCSIYMICHSVSVDWSIHDHMVIA